jgi:predicted transcriptional regulator
LQHHILQNKDIAEKIIVSPAILSYHLDKLVNQGIIEVQRFGSEKGYSLKQKKTTDEVSYTL